MADVVVTATSPALQGEQTVVSDASGEFEIPTLPPGTYLLHLEKEAYKPLNQPDIIVRLDKTVRANLRIVPESLKAEEVVVVGRAPTVDIGSTQTGATLTDDFINNIPIAAPSSIGGNVRSFESLAATSPGAAEDLYGVSISGTTSPENNYVIDGVNASNPAYGLNGSPLAVDFVKEVDVITGGYMPEFGRATGGVVNVVTKSGGNEFHGSLALYVQPGFLSATPKLVLEQGTAITVTPRTTLNSNLVAEVGGPIVKDKLWFYVGLEPTITRVENTRYINRVTYKTGCPVDADNNPVASAGDPAFARYSNDVTTCSPALQGNATDPNGSPIIDKTTPISETKRVYHDDTVQTQYIAKLTYLLNQDQRFTGSVFGNPGNRSGPRGALTGAFSAYDENTDFNTNDYSLRWDGSFFDKHMLAEAVAGWHHESFTNNPNDPALAAYPGLIYRREHSIVEFEPEAAQYCGADDASKDFKTCPIIGYTAGGPGFNFALEDTKLDSWQGKLALTNLFRAAGHHEVKYGVDYQLERYDHQFGYSGGVVYRESRGGAYWYDYRRFGYLQGPDDGVFQDSVHNVTKDYSIAGYIQDSYRILDLVTLNAGVRWEDQQLIGGFGDHVISLPYNVQPRVGLIYDFTQTGRSKIYANYGLFYEKVPIDLLDRNFPSQTTILGYHPKTVCDPRDPSQVKGVCSSTEDSVALGTPPDPNAKWGTIGSAAEAVDPHLKGQSTTEILAGGEYEVVPDGRVGVTYTHRNMNSVIEDMSNDGAVTYFIGNPGEGIAKDFPKATRNYNAGTIYFNKAFSHRWMVQASYTLSRLEGNYSGLFRPDDGQLDPNINADFDLKQFLNNATGPLPGDHTHNLKVYAAYELPTGRTSSLSLGLGYTGLSGGPTNFLGYDEVYGQPLSFILPRGSGDRLPWVNDVDASFRYNLRVTDTDVLSFSADIFNLFNFQTVTAVDQTYTLDTVLPIANGTRNDLNGLKNTSGTPAVKNPTFQQPIAYQSPFAVRLGVKFTF